MSIMLTMLMIIPIIFIYMKHPLMMVISLVMFSTFNAIILGTLSQSFWFSYILFLVMVGGMLVIFIYMTSISYNEKFNMTTSPVYLIMIAPITILLNDMNNNIHINLSMLSNSQEKLYLIKYMNEPYAMIMVMMIIYLLITLIATVKITKLSAGPLRQKY